MNHLALTDISRTPAMIARAGKRTQPRFDPQRTIEQRFPEIRHLLGFGRVEVVL